MPNHQFIAPNTIQSATFSLRARSRGFGGDYIDWQEWRRQPGDVDENTIQSALGPLNNDGNFAEVIRLGDCNEVKKVKHPVTGTEIKTRVRCEHWDRCKSEGLERCYRGQAVQDEKQRKLDYVPYIEKLLAAWRQANAPITFFEIITAHGIDGKHPDYQLWRGAFYHICRTGRLAEAGKVLLAGRTHKVTQWVVKE